MTTEHGQKAEPCRPAGDGGLRDGLHRIIVPEAASLLQGDVGRLEGLLVGLSLAADEIGECRGAEWCRGKSCLGELLLDIRLFQSRLDSGIELTDELFRRAGLDEDALPQRHRYTGKVR